MPDFLSFSTRQKYKCQREAREIQRIFEATLFIISRHRIARCDVQWSSLAGGGVHQSHQRKGPFHLQEIRGEPHPLEIVSRLG